MVDYNGTLPARTKGNSSSKGSSGRTGNVPAGDARLASNSSKDPTNGDDDVFSDSDEEETHDSESRKAETSSQPGIEERRQQSDATKDQIGVLTQGTNELSLQQKVRTQNNASEGPTAPKTPKTPKSGYGGSTDIKAMAADASVFSFGDEEDFDSD